MASLTQQQAATQFVSVNNQSAKFLPLDLSQSAAAAASVYNLYNAAASSVIAAQQFPLFNVASTQMFHTLSHPVGISTALLAASAEKSENLGSNNLTRNISSSDFVEQNNNNSAVPNLMNKPPLSAINNLTSMPLFVDNSSLPKSDIVTVIKSDYFSGNQRASSLSTCDSDSGSGASSTTSRVTPPNSCSVNVIVSTAGPPLPPPAPPSATTSKFADFDAMAVASSSCDNNNNNDGRVSNESSKKRKGLVRDDAYWERRRKNNDAAKRSRDSRRKKEDEVAIRAAILEQENLRLRFEIERLKSEIERYRFAAFTGPSASPTVVVTPSDTSVGGVGGRLNQQCSPPKMGLIERHCQELSINTTTAVNLSNRIIKHTAPLTNL